MEEKSDKQTYQAWYKEIVIGLLKITRSGKSLVVIIPKNITDKNNLEKGDELLFVAFKRNKAKFPKDALKPDEKWCKLTRAEMLHLKRFREEEAEIRKEAEKL